MVEKKALPTACRRAAHWAEQMVAQKVDQREEMTVTQWAVLVEPTAVQLVLLTAVPKVF